MLRIIQMFENVRDQPRDAQSFGFEGAKKEQKHCYFKPRSRKWRCWRCTVQTTTKTSLKASMTLPNYGPIRTIQLY